MPRPTYPRRGYEHAAKASEVLRRYASTHGTPVSLPVPIELIIEQVYGLEILRDEIPEPADTIILGALAPRKRRIILNSRHEPMFERWIGPERFTLAHELGHWLYDADDPSQQPLNLGPHPAEQYCYHRESPALTEVQWIREVNANKFAARLLLPEDLVRSHIDEVRADFSGTAARWQVSKKTLGIRLRELRLTDMCDTEQPRFA